MMVGYPYLVPDLEAGPRFFYLSLRNQQISWIFNTYLEKIFDFYLRQNVSKSIITFPK